MFMSIGWGIAAGAAVVGMCVAMFLLVRLRRDQPDMGSVSDRWIANERGAKMADPP